MPAPSTEVFDRLRQLVAIKDTAAREAKAIDEVFTGRPLTSIPVGTAVDVEAAFAGARTAQADWASRPVSERVEVIRRYRDLVVENREFLMDLLQAEAGKARWAAQEEIIDLMANANYYVRVAADLLKPRTGAGPPPGDRQDHGRLPTQGRGRGDLAVELPDDADGVGFGAGADRG